MEEMDIIARILALCQTRGWTVYRLSKESDIPYSTLCAMLHKATAPSIPTLLRLCRGFDISPSEFFDLDNGWATLSQEERDHLQQWNALQPDNRLAAKKYIRFLLQEQKTDIESTPSYEEP